MGKAQELRPGASGFSLAKRHTKKSRPKFFSGLDNGDGGDFLCTEKSKKEKLKKLSIIGVVNPKFEDCDMGSNLSDRDDETVGSWKKYKLRKKFFNDCDGVDQASVPRKLRSAMKKRNGDSVSPSPTDSKKMKARRRGVESLTSEGVKKSKLVMKQRTLEEKSSGLLDSEPITKDEEEVVESLYALAGMYANELSKMETDTLETKDSPVKDTLISNVPARHPEATNFQLNFETLGKEQRDVGEKREDKSEIEMQKSDTPLDIRESELHVKPVNLTATVPGIMPVGSLLEQKNADKEDDKNDLSSPELHDAGGSYQLHLIATAFTDELSKEEICSHGKVSRLMADGKWRKNCAAHIYISRLICSLQSKDRLLFQRNQSIPHQASKQRSRMAAETVRNDFSEANYTPLTDSKNGISHLKQLSQDRSQKLSFDFLSLSTKVDGLEASSSSHMRGIAMEPMTQLQVPHIYSVGQHHNPSFALLQTRHSPTSFSDQTSLSSTVSQQVNQPQYLGSQTSSHPHPSFTMSAKGQQWAAELASRYRPVETTTTNSELPCWLSGRNDSPSLVPFYSGSYAPSTVSPNSFL